MKITKEEFDLLFDENITKKKYDEIINKINLRFCKICERLYKRKDPYSWFDYDNGGYEEKQEGYFDPQKYKEYIDVLGEHQHLVLGYEDGFPTKWLWEDFEEEVKKTELKIKEEMKKAKQKLKEKRVERKQKIQQLKNSIESKLTPEELKIIKFKS